MTGPCHQQTRPTKKISLRAPLKACAAARRSCHRTTAAIFRGDEYRCLHGTTSLSRTRTRKQHRSTALDELVRARDCVEERVRLVQPAAGVMPRLSHLAPAARMHMRNDPAAEGAESRASTTHGTRGRAPAREEHEEVGVPVERLRRSRRAIHSNKRRRLAVARQPTRHGGTAILSSHAVSRHTSAAATAAAAACGAHRRLCASVMGTETPSNDFASIWYCAATNEGGVHKRASPSRAHRNDQRTCTYPTTRRARSSSNDDFAVTRRTWVVGTTV